MAKIFDFGSAAKRYHGHNFNLCHKLDEIGWEWQIACWHPEVPEVGDLIIMALDHDDIRAAIVTKVKRCYDPIDMYFLNITTKGGRKRFDELISGQDTPSESTNKRKNGFLKTIFEAIRKALTKNQTTRGDSNALLR